MRRSLRLQVFLRLFFSALLVILVNRFIAQHLLTEQIAQQARLDMGHHLSACQQFPVGTTGLSDCILKPDGVELTRSLSAQYKVCARDAAALDKRQAQQCQRLLSTQTSWQRGQNARFEYTHVDLDGTTWIGVKLLQPVNRSGSGSQLWISSDDIDLFVKQLWDLRDNTLIYVVPAILLLLVLMALYMTRFVMGVLNQLNQSLSTVNINNVDKRVKIIAHFNELEALASVFEQMQIRMEESFDQRQRFVSDASHELRTPLSILRGTAHRLIDESEPGSDAQLQLRSVADEIERLIDIVDRLLLLSRADSDDLRGQMTLVDLSELLRSYVFDLQALESGVDIQAHIEPGIYMQADETLLTQLLQNLFANALKYNIHDGWVRARLAIRQGMLELCIENTTGPLRPEIEAQAFERFFRGDKARSRQTGGFGLGLSICQEIAHLHEGKMDLKVTPENTFVISFVAPLSR